MEGKWVTPSGEGQQCVCEETSQEAFSHSQQTPPEENQEKISTTGLVEPCLASWGMQKRPDAAW